MSKPKGNFFSPWKPVGQKFLIMILVVYEVWNSIEQEFDGVACFGVINNFGTISGLISSQLLIALGHFVFFGPLRRPLSIFTRHKAFPTYVD